ncbi:MAG: 50S ribosomal protein L18 [Dehalococcoidia bacterium]
MGKDNTKESREIRHKRVRKSVVGTAERPRLCVYRSLTHIYCQLIDDSKGCTLASASTLDSELKSDNKKKTETSASVGKMIAERAAEFGIKKVVFDRGGYKYHGRVKALADAARKAGLEF